MTTLSILSQTFFFKKKEKEKKERKREKFRDNYKK